MVRAAAAGLRPLPVDAHEEDPFALLGMLTGPRALIAQGPDQVVVTGLASLAIDEGAAWAEALSAACSAEVVVIELRERGARVEVYDDGELDEAFDVPLGKGGVTRAPALGVLATTEAGEAALEAGLAAATPEALAEALAEALGAAVTDGEETRLCVFEAPEEEEVPALVASATVGAMLEGQAAGPVTSMLGQPVFGVTLAGTASLTGLRLELGGDALALLAIDEVDVVFRTATGGREARTLPAAKAASGALAFALPEAHLDWVPEGLADFDHRHVRDDPAHPGRRRGPRGQQIP